MRFTWNFDIVSLTGVKPNIYYISKNKLKNIIFWWLWHWILQVKKKKLNEVNQILTPFFTTIIFQVGRIAESQPGLKYAFAGRNKDKLNLTLETARVNTGLDLTQADLIVVNVNDEENLKEMASQTKVVINCVGPVSMNKCYKKNIY